MAIVTPTIMSGITPVITPMAMPIVIGIGSNLGNRWEHIAKATMLLNQAGLAVQKVASVIENPALLPPNAPSQWNRPFLNTAVLVETLFSPIEALAVLKRIERDMGRLPEAERWSPRIIDLDILVWGDSQVDVPMDLTIPHRDLCERHFAVVPLAELLPYWQHPIIGKTALQLAEEVQQRAPSRSRFQQRIFAPHTQLVGIVNITPDSFSDGGCYETPGIAYAHIAGLVSAGASVIDIGAQSTRPGPGATLIGPAAEWTKLEPVLQSLSQSPFRDSVSWSIDTYHHAVAKKAIEDFNVDWINDVSGGNDPALCKLLAATGKTGVFMHSVSLPADAQQVLPFEPSILEQLNSWAVAKVRLLEGYGLAPGQIILDPGIGFGKTARQSMVLLKVVGQLRQQWAKHGIRILVGHSRKSYIRAFSEVGSPVERDLETISISTVLHQHKIDYLRIHQVDLHRRALAAMYVAAGPY